MQLRYFKLIEFFTFLRGNWLRKKNPLVQRKQQKQNISEMS